MDYKFNDLLSKVATNLGVGAGVYDIGSGTTDRYRNIFAVNFKGDATAAYYADLAEKYTVDPELELPIGTVMEASSGKYDAEISQTEVSDCVIGIISEFPGFVMNESLKDSAIIGLVGTVPVRVVGQVYKKDVLVSAGNGCLRVAVNDYEKSFKVAISLQTNNSDEEKLVKCFVK